MDASTNYTLMNDSNDAQVSARNSILMRGFQPVSTTNPGTQCSDDSSPEEERESSPKPIVRSPKRSILKKNPKPTTRNEENGMEITRAKGSRVLFSEENCKMD